MIPEKLAGCVITDSNGDVLLIHRNTTALTQWEIPGGKHIPGEKYQQTAQREVLEELGVAVGNLVFIGVTFFPAIGSNFVQVLFKAEILEGNPSPQETKHDYADYFNLENIESNGMKLSAGIHALNDAIRKGRIKL